MRINYQKPEVKILNMSTEFNANIYKLLNLLRTGTRSTVLTNELLNSDFITLEIKCNRLQSLLLCELRDSYSIQSQRYCIYPEGELNVIINRKSLLEKELNYTDITSIIYDGYSLYEELTQLKDESKDKSKYTIKDFVNGVPAEDGRYLLSTCFITNMVMTINGEDLVDFLWCLKKNDLLMSELSEELFKQCPALSTVTEELFKETKISNSYEGDSVPKPDNDNIEVYSNDLYVSGAAALTCTNMEMPHELLQRKNLDKVAYRVASMNHTSILEHTKIGIYTTLSIASYNQLVRHRHHTIIRNDFAHMFKSGLFYDNTDLNELFVIPDTFNYKTNSKLTNALSTKITDYFKKVKKVLSNVKYKIILQDGLKKFYSQSNISLLFAQLLPMATRLNLYVNSNLSNELYVCEKRTCMKAQWELRNMTYAKVKKLREIFNNNKILDGCLPPCLKDGCREGKECCGKTNEVRRILLADEVNNVYTIYAKYGIDRDEIKDNASLYNINDFYKLLYDHKMALMYKDGLYIPN